MAVAALLALALQATGSPDLAAPPAVKPVWAHKPGGRAIELVYPPVARNRFVAGVTELECQLTFTGGLADCKVVVEDPAGFGFGAAALSLAPEFLAQPPQPNEVGARLRIPMRFQMPRLKFGPRIGKITVTEPGSVGHAEVSCQAYTHRVDDCVVVKADPTVSRVHALIVAERIPLGHLAPGTHFVLPIEFKPAEPPTP